jgi:hypothetical protein
MKRLILTFDDSAAGALRGAGLADCVVPFGLCFVWGRLRPANELKTFLSPRAAKPAAADFHWLDNLNGAQLEEARKQGAGLIEFCERFETVELWADPEPNAQLQLVWLLDHISGRMRISRPKLLWSRRIRGSAIVRQRIGPSSGPRLFQSARIISKSPLRPGRPGARQHRSRGSICWRGI